MTTAILRSDENLHPAGTAPHWQESFYFNWADLEAKTLGFARIGYRFDDRKADAVVITMRDGKRELVYGAVDQPVQGDMSKLLAADGLKIGRLTLRSLDALQRWQIKLDGKDEVDLTWTALAPAFDFGHDGSQVIAARHFEHPGTVTGHTRIGGHQRAFHGFGTRDKSWGPRDWNGIEGWDWISAQFGNELSFTAAQSPVDGGLDQSGFLYRKGVCRAIESFQLDYKFAGSQVAKSANLTITDSEGEVYLITAQSVAQLPLFKRGLMLEETHASLVAHLGDGTVLRGAGLLEHTFHIGTLGVLTRLPRLLPVVKAALVSRFR